MYLKLSIPTTLAAAAAFIIFPSAASAQSFGFSVSSENPRSAIMLRGITIPAMLMKDGKLGSPMSAGNNVNAGNTKRHAGAIGNTSAGEHSRWHGGDDDDRDD